MNIQVLVAAMNQSDHSLLQKMNIRSNVIVGNQCNYNSIETFDYMGNEAIYLNFAERGVGLNRNNTLIRATGDICLFADDDVVYVDDYVNIITKTYKEQPNADVIIFNFLESRNGEPLHERVRKNGFVGRKGVSSFATFLISVRLNSVRKKNIVFHQMFGGGARYSHGEDSIFLKDCISKGLKVYTTTKVIGTVRHNESTWFQGFSDQHFKDTGVLFYQMYTNLYYVIIVYHVLKHKKMYKNYGILNVIKMMFDGIKHYKKRE